jgi:ABC-type nitrate/sulfonate/bicarbonate transport system substrate-binding protein
LLLHDDAPAPLFVGLLTSVELAPVSQVKMSTDKITFLTNWHATPYHAPLYLAQSKGYFKDEGIKVALLEPNDPSDVTEIIGSGKVDLGFKAMIHTLAAAARGFPVQSIGSLLNEPFTGVVYLTSSGITSDFTTLKGKKIGYVGEFGKIQLDGVQTRSTVHPNSGRASLPALRRAPPERCGGRPLVRSSFSHSVFPRVLPYGRVFL